MQPREDTLNRKDGFAQDERFPVFPVWLVVDTSSSMAGEPIGAVNAALPELKRLVEKDPSVGEIARIGIITFADTADRLLDLSDLQFVEMPTVASSGSTNYRAAFETARREIETGIRGLGKGTRFHAPVVFFMSDGQPTTGGDWTEALRALTDPGWRFRCEIVAFGFGVANEETLGRVATRHALMAKDGRPAEQAKEIMATIIGSIRTTSNSLHGPEGGGLAVPVDPDKFTPLPVLEV